MLLDLRGCPEDESLKKVRDILRYSLPEDEILEVLISSEHFAKKMSSFLCMSGCQVESLRKGSDWIVRMTGKNCNCQ